MTTFVDRRDAVLSRVVERYIQSGEPVGSAALEAELGVSAATVRNVFSRLGKEGLLAQPHTSAGRVPTEEGYRCYVDRLMKAYRLSLQEQEWVRRAYEAASQEVEDLLKVSARILSSVLRLVGVAVIPVFKELSLERFQLVRVAPKRILVVVVLRNGWVREELVKIDRDLSREELQRVVGFLNRRFSGQSVEDIQREWTNMLKQERARRLQLLSHITRFLEHLLTLNRRCIQLEGARNLILQKEFQNPNEAEKLVELLEDPEPLAKILEKRWCSTGTMVSIGRELTDHHLEKFSLVFHPYHVEGSVVGFLGLLGPTRMPYRQAVGWVEYLAGNVDRNLTGGF